MTRKIFADSAFLLGLMADDDQHKSKSTDILEHLQNNHLISDINDFHISNYIIVEVIHGLIDKHTSIRQIKEKYDDLKQCHVFPIEPKHIDEAFSKILMLYCYNQSKNRPMGIVDALSVIAMGYEDIPYIISFDGHFDIVPLIKRIGDKDVIDHDILRH
ncbi:PIN domain protein [uncultured archaeon]|nr:PIN domain protein [uncultured archaeon]